MLSDAEKARLLLDLREQRRVTWAHFDRMEERRLFLEWLAAEAPKPVVPLSFLGEGEPWARIVAASRGAGVVVVSGDELLWGEARDAWRRALNLGRDRIAELEAPVVVLADQALLDEVAQRAPDLWSWRGSVVEGDYEPWTVGEGEEPRRAGFLNDPLWADVAVRPDLYVPPPEGSAFARLLEEVPRHLVPGSEGCGIVGVRGAGRRTLAIEVARRLEGRATLLWHESHGLDTDELGFLGHVLRSVGTDVFVQEELSTLGRELGALLGPQLSGFAKDLFEGRQVSSLQQRRLRQGLERGPGMAGVHAAVSRCLERAERLGRPAVVLLACVGYHPPARWLTDLGLPVFDYLVPRVRRPQPPPLDSTPSSGLCQVILERRAPWLPKPLRETVVRWADGLPGFGLRIASYAQGRIEHGELTRQDVATAAAEYATDMGAEPRHDAILSDPTAPPLSRWEILDLWTSAFLRYPPDGGPPYVHPLWLLALGRDVDPFGPPVLLPRRSDIPECWEQFVQQILTDPLPDRRERPGTKRG